MTVLMNNLRTLDQVADEKQRSQRNSKTSWRPGSLSWNVRSSQLWTSWQVSLTQ